MLVGADAGGSAAPGALARAISTEGNAFVHFRQALPGTD